MLMCFQLSTWTQFDSWTLQHSFLSMDILDWDSYFVFNPRDPRLKIYVEVDNGIVLILNFEMCCSRLAASQIQWWVPTVLFFFWNFFLRSGLLEYWKWSYVQGHFFGSLLLGTQLNSPCIGFICPSVIIDPTNLGMTIVVAQAWCWSSFNLSPTQNACLLTDGNKASVCVLLYVSNDKKTWLVQTKVWEDFHCFQLKVQMRALGLMHGKDNNVLRQIQELSAL